MADRPERFESYMECPGVRRRWPGDIHRTNWEGPERANRSQALDASVRPAWMDAEIYRVVFNVMPVLAFLTDGRGVIGDANAAAAAFLNVERQALRMKPLLHFVARADTRAFRKRVQDGILGPFMTRLRPRHGAPCAMTMAVSYLAPSDRLVWTAIPAVASAENSDPTVPLAAE